MAYSYGTPEQGLPRPRCWGDERFFNPNMRDCRSCPVQGSCRDELLRARNYQAQPPYQPPTQQPVFYPGYQVPPPTATPATTVPISPYSTQARQIPVHAPQQVQVQPQVQMFPAPQRYQYGWLSDPLYSQMFSVPPPMIPQLPGESFVERLGKNALRDAGLSLAANLFWALRQMVLAPPEQRQQMVDVTKQQAGT